MRKVTNQLNLAEVDKIPTSIYCMHDYIAAEGVALHAHKKDQLLYTEGGLVHVKVQGITYFLPARHYMWIPRGLEHSIHPGQKTVIMRNLYFPVAKSNTAFSASPGIYPVTDLLLEMLLFSNKWAGDILPKEKVAYSFVSSIRGIIPELSVNKLPLMLPMPTDKRLIEIVNFMDENMHTAIALPELATQFGFSERSLSRLFKSDIGMSFVQYHTIQRMLKALNLLLEEKMQIKEVAMLVGYNSIPTFSSTFRKILRINPSSYSNQNKNREPK